MEDWPDAILRMWADEDEGTGERTYWFSARGRDVDVSKRGLLFNPATRKQELEEEGMGPLQGAPLLGQVDVRAEILSYLGKDPAGISSSILARAIRAPREEIDQALEELQQESSIYMGTRDGRFHLVGR